MNNGYMVIGDYRPVQTVKNGAVLAGYKVEKFDILGEQNVTFTAYGTAKQDGVPTPFAPIEPVFSYEVSPEGVPPITLYAIPDGNGGYYARDELVSLEGGCFELRKNVGYLELDATWDWGEYTYGGMHGVWHWHDFGFSANRQRGISTHIPAKAIQNMLTDGQLFWIGVNGSSIYWIGILDVLGLTTAAEFEEWLAAQTAAGTPVRIWYALPETLTKKWAATEKTYNDEVNLVAHGRAAQAQKPAPTVPVIPQISYGATVMASPQEGSAREDTTITIPTLYAIPDGKGGYLCRDKLEYIGNGDWLYTQTVEEVELLSSKVSTGIYNYDGIKGISAPGIFIQSANRAKGMSTHESYFVSQWNTPGRHYMWLGVNSYSFYWVGILDHLGFTTVDEFKAWLDEQKADGTPVMIWKVLNNPIKKTLHLGELKTYPHYTEVDFKGDYLPDIAATVKVRKE